MLGVNENRGNNSVRGGRRNLFADIDLDVTIHLGILKNIDLLSRGVYGIKITLVYGENEQRILPIGLFSAPSRLDAIVRDIRIAPPSQFTNCTIDNDSASFISRSIVIRYRDETHELNEGVHWRLTIPNCDLSDYHRSATDNSIICSEPLIFRFELLFCELLEHDGSSDLVNNIDEFLPVDPILASVSTQELQIQQASTGFHHYFPIRFDRSHVVSLECMIHTAITAVRYQTVVIDVLRSPSLSEVGSPRTQIIDREMPNQDDEIQDFDPVSSGTWYEHDIEKSGPVIDETYYKPDDEIITTNSDTPQTTPNTELPPRRSFKTPPTTVVSTMQRPKSTTYHNLTEKLSDLTLTLQNPMNIHRGEGNLSDQSIKTSDSIAPSISSPTSTPTKQEVNSNSKSVNSPAPAAPVAGAVSSPQRLKAISELEKMNSTESIELEGEREAFSEIPRKPVSSSGLDRVDIESLVQFYCRPLISNHHILRAGTQFIIDLFNIWNQEEISRSMKLSAKTLSRTSIDVLCDSAFDCSLEVNQKELIDSLMLEQSMAEVCLGLSRALERCNLEMCKRWSLVLSSLPKVMKEIAGHLRGKYLHGMCSFWKGQSVLFRCSSSMMRRPNPDDDSSATELARLLSQLQKEFKISSRPIATTTEIVNGIVQSDSDVLHSPTLRPTVKARGLPLFDRSTHLITSKLPVMLIHEYAGKTEAAKNPEDKIISERGGKFREYPGDVHMNSLANVWNLTLSSHCYPSYDPCTSLDQTTSPVHLIILQHGFQGTAFDMRLIRNALHMEFPHYLFMIATSNEADSGQSLAVMAQRLAQEILDFCREKCPSLVYESSREGRVSFIGHSVGGLIIRKCLERPELNVLLPKLHLYVSLASPHLGTLYAESPLVSTGMWALVKFKKTPILQELALKDSSDYNTTALYSLSDNGVLQYFRRVVFITSPNDLYVPEYSARVQINPKALLNPHVGYTLTSMAANVLSQIEPDRLFRITLTNNIFEAGNVDKAIGRAGHICYLDNMAIAEGLIYTLYSIFN